MFLSGPRGLRKQARDVVMLERNRCELIALMAIYSYVPHPRHSLLI